MAINKELVTSDVLRFEDFGKESCLEREFIPYFCMPTSDDVLDDENDPFHPKYQIMSAKQLRELEEQKAEEFTL